MSTWLSNARKNIVANSATKPVEILNNYVYKYLLLRHTRNKMDFIYLLINSVKIITLKPLKEF